MPSLAVWRTRVNSVSCDRGPRSDMFANPLAGFPAPCRQLPVCQTLSPLLSPIITPRLAGIGAWFSELFGALWPDQRHVQAAQDTPRSKLVAPLLASGLPALGSSGRPLSVLGIATSWLSGQLRPRRIRPAGAVAKS